MTNVFITVDTELSVGRHMRGLGAYANLCESVFGVCGQGSFGIQHQMQRLDAYGLKAVFFIDPLPAQVFGLDIIKRMVVPILEAGHEAQLHIHTEWLPHMSSDPVDGRRGTNIRDFSYEDQCRLLGLARELLVAAGAPAPLAFRAGNYGACDVTLRALASIGILDDSSFNPGYAAEAPKISLPLETVEPVLHQGVVEFPISCISDRPGHFRHAQLCALSAWEMQDALRHAVACGQEYFTLVSHSFELLSRDRLRANHTVVDRFERLCALLAEPGSGLQTMTYGQLDPAALGQAVPRARLSPSLWRTAHRMGEQVVSSLRYERKGSGSAPRPALPRSMSAAPVRATKPSG